MKMHDVVAHPVNQPAQRRNTTHVGIVAHDDWPRANINPLTARQQQSARVGQ
jgi:hypothetical protein